MQQARLGQRLGRDIAGMRAAPDQVRRAHHHLDAVIVAGTGCRLGRWEFGEMRAVAGRGGDLRRGRVVMAGQHGAKTARLGHGGGLMQRAEPVAQRAQTGDMVGKARVIKAVLAADVILQLRQVAKLPLTRGVVHQADDADAVIGAELGQFGYQRFRTDLGPQVQKMADPQRAPGPQIQDLIRQRAGIFAVIRRNSPWHPR